MWKKRLTATVAGIWVATAMAAAPATPILDVNCNAGTLDALRDISGKSGAAKIVTPEKIAWGEGPDGPALAFKDNHKTPRGGISFKLPADFDPAKGFTLRLGFKTATDYDYKQVNDIFHFADGVDKFTGFKLFLYYRCVYFRLGDKPANIKDAVSVPSKHIIKPDTWYDCTVVYDGKNAVVYLSGKPVSPEVAATVARPRFGTATLGCSRTTGAGYGFNGLLSMVRLYDRAFTAAEVAALE